MSILALAAGLALILAQVLIHYEALILAGRLMARFHVRPRRRVVVAILTCVAAHLVEMGLLAAALAGLLRIDGMGRIAGAFEPGLRDWLYLAMTTFTTLGIGDIWPEGPIRLVVGLCALHGFLLITWSASFTFLMMQRYWQPKDDGRKDRAAADRPTALSGGRRDGLSEVPPPAPPPPAQ